jgi:phosphotransferase system HPr (HPr) family protein
MASGPHRRTVVVLTEHGLHIRPCQLVAQLAQQFQARVGLARDGRSADAKSVFDLMTLAAGPGVELELETEGDDAEAALQQIGELFDHGFGPLLASAAAPER